MTPVISTKCGMIWDKKEGTYWSDKGGESIYINVSAKVIREEILRSLKRLGTDYIDIYYPHNPARAPFLTPVEETVEALMRLKKEGYIRAIGMSNAKPEQVEEYLACGCEIDILQRKYNILEREFVENNLLPLCRKYGMSFHAYSPAGARHPDRKSTARTIRWIRWMPAPSSCGGSRRIIPWPSTLWTACRICARRTTAR